MGQGGWNARAVSGLGRFWTPEDCMTQEKHDSEMAAAGHTKSSRSDGGSAPSGFGSQGDGARDPSPQGYVRQTYELQSYKVQEEYHYNDEAEREYARNQQRLRDATAEEDGQRREILEACEAVAERDRREQEEELRPGKEEFERGRQREREEYERQQAEEAEWQARRDKEQADAWARQRAAEEAAYRDREEQYRRQQEQRAREAQQVRTYLLLAL